MMRWSLALVLCAAAAFAQPESKEAEARRRFELAARLYAQGNKEQALDEFERVRALAERPAVLLNLVIIHSELGHAEAAVTVADQLLAMKTTLDQSRLERVRTIRSEQRAKLGEVRLTAPVAGVELTLDGKPLGVSPLAGPVLAMAGNLVLAAKAPKFEPLYQQLTVPAGGVVEVALELKATNVNPAAVRVRCPVPGAELFVDGLRVGTTPEVVKLAVLPGARTISARREGYRSAEKSVTLPEGGEVEVELVPVIDESGASFAEVSVKASEDQVTTTADGQRLGLLASSALKLPPGPHLLQFERGGFYPIKRALSLAPNASERLELVFEPTPELRGELTSSAGWHRLLGWIGVGVGVAGLAGSAGYTFGYLDVQRASAIADYDALNAQVENKTGCWNDEAGCFVGIMEAQTRKRQTDSLYVVSAAGFIVSGLLIGGGIISLLTTPDLGRYDRQPSNGDFLQQLGLVPLPGGGFAFAAAGQY
jgi:hypothetical protein